MAVSVAEVRDAIARIATPAGVSAADVRASFLDLFGHEPGQDEVQAQLARLSFAGLVRRSGEHGEQYFWHETDTAVEVRHPPPGRAIDIMIGDRVRPWAHGAEETLLGRVANVVWPPRQRLEDGLWPQWEPRGSEGRVYVNTNQHVGDWTLVYLSKSPTNRYEGPGWYLYGPDVASLFLHAGSGEEAQRAGDDQVRGYALVQRARAAVDYGTRSPIPDHVRAAIHAGHVSEVVIFCDWCGVKERGDFIGETREDRFAAARRHLELRKGWECEEQDSCPVCRAKGAR